MVALAGMNCSLALHRRVSWPPLLLWTWDFLLLEFRFVGSILLLWVSLDCFPLFRLHSWRRKPVRNLQISQIWLSDRITEACFCSEVWYANFKHTFAVPCLLIMDFDLVCSSKQAIVDLGSAAWLCNAFFLKCYHMVVSIAEMYLRLKDQLMCGLRSRLFIVVFFIVLIFVSLLWNPPAIGGLQFISIK